MDFVSVWKIIAIALTGFFGILGLVTEFKEKSTGRVTKWGKFSLLGIVVSTIGGAAAQLREFSDQEAAKIKSARETLAVVEDIRRTLSPIDEPTVTMSFSILCDREKFEAYCDHLPLNRSPEVAEKMKAEAWKNFPEKLNGQPVLGISLLFFRHEQLVERYLKHDGYPNLEYWLQPTHSGDNPDLQGIGDRKNPGLYIENYKLKISRNDGTFVSMRDFSDSTVLVHISSPCVPTWLAIDSKNHNGISTDAFDPQFKEISDPVEYGARGLYRYKFPNASLNGQK